MELFENNEIPKGLLTFWNRDIENRNISKEVWQKWSVTPKELFENLKT